MQVAEQTYQNKLHILIQPTISSSVTQNTRSLMAT